MNHPRHHQKTPAEASHKPGNRIESAVLNGSNHLNQTDDNPGNKPDRQQRSGNPERRNKHLADKMSHSIRRHRVTPAVALALAVPFWVTVFSVMRKALSSANPQSNSTRPPAQTAKS